MFKKKTVRIYYCDDCGTEYGINKPTEPCKHEVCGHCVHYNDKGFCCVPFTDSCADRDSDALCSNGKFTKKDIKLRVLKRERRHRNTQTLYTVMRIYTLISLCARSLRLIFFKMISLYVYALILYVVQLFLFLVKILSVFIALGRNVRHLLVFVDKSVVVFNRKDKPP